MSFNGDGRQRLAALIDSTGLTLSADELATSTGSGADDPFIFEPERAIGVLATALARVHAASVQDVGGIQGLGIEDHGDEDHGLTGLLGEPEQESSVVGIDDLVLRARKSLEDPESELSPLSPSYSHMSRGRLVDILSDGAEAVRERCSGPVLNQGRPTLGNLRFAGVELLGFADWSDACLADPYLDLAMACRDIFSLFGAPPVRVLLEQYSSEPLDPVRLDWFTLAIELVP
ncbi:MAG: phosphotransferase [Microthrixaceae bacterium]